MTELERRLLALLAALQAENDRLLALVAVGRGLKWAERQVGWRRIVV